MASISAPSIREQICERKFAKLILTVRKLFRANFAISALTNDIRWTGGLLRTMRRRILSTSAPAAACRLSNQDKVRPLEVRNDRAERDKFGTVANRHSLSDRPFQDALYDWNNRSGNCAGRNRASDDDQKSLLVLCADRAAKVGESVKQPCSNRSFHRGNSASAIAQTLYRRVRQPSRSPSRHGAFRPLLPRWRMRCPARRRPMPCH